MVQSINNNSINFKTKFESIWTAHENDLDNVRVCGATNILGDKRDAFLSDSYYLNTSSLKYTLPSIHQTQTVFSELNYSEFINKLVPIKFFVKAVEATNNIPESEVDAWDTVF